MKLILLNKLTILICFHVTCLYGEISSNKSYNLFSSLLDEKEWVLDENIEDITISKKALNSKNIFALKVEKKSFIPIHTIQEVLKDINRYDEFLSNSKTVKSLRLNHSDNWVDAYQYISSNIPFLSDRKYCFRISSEQINKDDSLSIVHWFLLDQNECDILGEMYENNAIYLHFGAGLWLAEKQSDGSSIISYIIYIDPGGAIPTFVIDKANRISVTTILEDVLTEASRRIKKRGK